MSKYQYDGENGVHRVPLWRIGGFALNNIATNMYMMMMAYVAYYLVGFVGLATVAASSFSMAMRLWDGVTDPFVGLIIDRISTRFGKNRPFIVIGNVILLVASYIMFHVTHLLPEGPVRLIFFVIVSAIYYIGYTFQCVVTKSAQVCLTNDPKQRPNFALFNGIFNMVMMTALTFWITNMLIPKYGTVVNTDLFHELWLVTAIVSAVMTMIAVVSIAPKDIPKYYGLGTGTAEKIGFKDYWDVIKNNRALQMLIVSASTDKLATSAKTSTVNIVMFGIVVGNLGLAGAFTAYTNVTNLVLLFLGVSVLARKMGQRRAMLVGSWGALIGNLLLCALWLFGNPRSFNLPGYEGFNGFTFFTVALFVLTVLAGGFMNITTSMVLPMTADVSDYETYRSGRYVPGLIGTLFSFVDKVISSLAPMIAGVAFAAIGFKETLPDVQTPYSDDLLYVGVLLSYGIIIFALLCNVLAMKFYPLTREKMEEIQDKIAEIKRKTLQPSTK